MRHLSYLFIQILWWQFFPHVQKIKGIECVYGGACYRPVFITVRIRDCRVKPGNDTIKPGNDTIKPGNDSHQSGNDTIKSCNGTLKSGGDTLQSDNGSL